MYFAAMPDTLPAVTPLPVMPERVKSAPSTLAFYSPDPEGRVTGGFLYNQQLQSQLQVLGWHVEQVEEPEIEHQAEVHLVDSLMAVAYMQGRQMRHSSESQKALFLYHLPPFAGQLVPPHWMVIERHLIEAGCVVVTGTQCCEVLRERHNLRQEQLQKYLNIITPGIADNWQRKSTFSTLPNKLIVLASVIPQKGIAAIVDALAELTRLPWRCIIYGETQQNPVFYLQMVEKVAALALSQRIQFAGTIAPTQVNQLMCDADLLINGSEFETYSMVTAEAIATGLPVLSTPVGETQHFQQASNVQYLKGHQFAELRHQLQTILTDPESYLRLCQSDSSTITGTSIRKSWRETAQQWQSLFERKTGSRIFQEVIA